MNKLTSQANQNKSEMASERRRSSWLKYILVFKFLRLMKSDKSHSKNNKNAGVPTQHSQHQSTKIQQHQRRESDMRSFVSVNMPNDDNYDPSVANYYGQSMTRLE